MTKTYICKLCKKCFTQKIDLKRHENKKSSCITIKKMKALVKKEEDNKDNKSGLITLFKSCLDILRDREHLTGDKALRTISQLLEISQY